MLLTDDDPIGDTASVSLTDMDKDTLLSRHVHITAGHFFVQASPRSHSKTCLAPAAELAWSLTKRLLKDGKLLLFLCTLLFLHVFLWRKDTFLAQNVIPLCVFIWVLQQNKKWVMCIQGEFCHLQKLTQASFSKRQSILLKWQLSGWHQTVTVSILLMLRLLHHPRPVP